MCCHNQVAITALGMTHIAIKCKTCLIRSRMAKAAIKATTSQPPTTEATAGGPFIEFVAEIKQVTSKKTASLDMEYRVVLASDDELVNTLGLVDADRLVKCRVEVVS
jgi:hypothetical protein